MTTWLVTHHACLDHDTGPGHPESVERLRAVLAALEDPAFQFLQRHEAPLASVEQIARVHDRAYVERTLATIPDYGYRALDADTMISPGSGEAALRAAGALCMAVDAVMAGEVKRVFCAVRPPGHHAERAQAMGFCLFNNVAIGAAHAREAHGLKRVAVLDFDVHHGNGSEHMLLDQPGYLYLSSHQSPLYPGSGERCGSNIVNLPLPPSTGGEEYRDHVRATLLPALRDFKPQLIFISAGFDGHQDDPLANLRLSEADFEWVTDAVVEIAREHCEGRVISTLEGGYNLRALGRSAAAHVRALL